MGDKREILNCFTLNEITKITLDKIINIKEISLKDSSNMIQKIEKLKEKNLYNLFFYYLTKINYINLKNKNKNINIEEPKKIINQNINIVEKKIKIQIQPKDVVVKKETEIPSLEEFEFEFNEMENIEDDVKDVLTNLKKYSI